LKASQVEGQREQIETERAMALERSKDLGEGPGKQLAILKAYDQQILKLIEDERKLKLAEIEATTPAGEGREAEKARVNAEADRARQRVLRGELVETQKVADQMLAHFREVFTRLGADFGNAIKSWITGSEKFGEAMRRMGLQMAADFAARLVEMAFQKFVIDRLMHASTALTGAAQVGTEAAVAGAETTAYYAAINPPMAIPAGLAMMASTLAAFEPVAGLEQGGLTSPHLGATGALAVLHPNELVIPSPLTTQLASVLNTTSTTNRTANLELHYHGYQGQSKESMKLDARAFAKQMDKSLRQQNRPPIVTLGY
jgi:hypothetical protein